MAPVGARVAWAPCLHSGRARAGLCITRNGAPGWTLQQVRLWESSPPRGRARDQQLPPPRPVRNGERVLRNPWVWAACHVEAEWMQPPTSYVARASFGAPPSCFLTCKVEGITVLIHRVAAGAYVRITVRERSPRNNQVLRGRWLLLPSSPENLLLSSPVLLNPSRVRLDSGLRP